MGNSVGIQRSSSIGFWNGLGDIISIRSPYTLLVWYSQVLRFHSSISSVSMTRARCSPSNGTCTFQTRALAANATRSFGRSGYLVVLRTSCLSGVFGRAFGLLALIRSVGRSVRVGDSCLPFLVLRVSDFLRPGF